MSDEFISHADLGRHLGVSEHRLIRLLVLIGLRSRDRMPSVKALEDGLVKDRDATPGRHHWLWHREKTVTAIEDAVRDMSGKEEE